jgi:hypothetical protein
MLYKICAGYIENPNLRGSYKFVKFLEKAGRSEYHKLECIVGQHSGTSPKMYYSEQAT